MTPSHVDSIRASSRRIVRALGLLNHHTTWKQLSLSQCHALLELDANKGLGQTQLMELLQLEKSTVSRTVAELKRRGWVLAMRSPNDARQRTLRLSANGHRLTREIHKQADATVGTALQQLTPEEQDIVENGLRLYAKALGHANTQRGYSIRPIQQADNPPVAHIIRAVMPEYGATGAGFAIHDTEVDCMCEAYSKEGSAYYVIEHQGQVVGGGGIAPLQGATKDVCELRKMYFLASLRGKGLANRLLNICLATAKDLGYSTCYLETLASMGEANRLYRKFGFQPLCSPMGNTGHFGCDRWYSKPL